MEQGMSEEHIISARHLFSSALVPVARDWQRIFCLDLVNPGAFMFLNSFKVVKEFHTIT